jgi:hypothetical protein
LTLQQYARFRQQMGMATASLVAGEISGTTLPPTALADGQQGALTLQQ